MFITVVIVKGEGCAKTGDSNPQFGCFSQGLLEELIQEQVLKVGLTLKGLSLHLQKTIRKQPPYFSIEVKSGYSKKIFFAFPVKSF
jgi:hypothetical protein